MAYPWVDGCSGSRHHGSAKKTVLHPGLTPTQTSLHQDLQPKGSCCLHWGQIFPHQSLSYLSILSGNTLTDRRGVFLQSQISVNVVKLTTRIDHHTWLLISPPVKSPILISLHSTACISDGLLKAIPSNSGFPLISLICCSMTWAAAADSNSILTFHSHF